MNSPDAESPPTRLARLGGEEVVHQLVGAFYDLIETLPEAARIRDMHQDLPNARARLELFLVEWFGGPKDYRRERGHPRLRMRHSEYAISPSEEQAWLTCMRRALEEVVGDATIREELDHAFARVAGALVNQ